VDKYVFKKPATANSQALANIPVDFQLISIWEINFQIRAAHARGKRRNDLGKMKFQRKMNEGILNVLLSSFISKKRRTKPTSHHGGLARPLHFHSVDNTRHDLLTIAMRHAGRMLIIFY
jgi:hypothetical protein